MRDLQREASPRRRLARRALDLAAVVTIAAGVAAAARWPRTPAAPATVVTVAPAPPPAVIVTPVPVAVPHVVEVAAPAPAAVSAPLGACPPPDPARDARVGDPVDRNAAGFHELDGRELVGVVASTHRRGQLVAWSALAIYLSEDDGRTFREVLVAPGDVTAVALDCHGRVVALRDRARLGVRHGDDEGWRALDFLAPAASDEADYGVTLAADAGAIAIVGPPSGDSTRAILAASRDAGATWRFAELGPYEGTRALRVGGDGDVRVVNAWGDCMAEGATAFVFDPATGALASDELEDGRGRYGQFLVDDDGWVHRALTYDVRIGPAARRFGEPDRPWRPLAPGAAPAAIDDLDDRPDDHLLAPGYLVTAGALYRLHGGRATRVARGVPDLPFQAIDGAGRLLAVVDGALVRWSPRHGLRALRGRRG